MNDIRDIKPPIFFITNYTLFFVLLLLLLLALLAYLGVFLYRKYKKKKEIPPPPKPPHILAYEALEVLKAKDLPGQGKIKEYYFELSNIVRKYIENKFDIKAPEMTTEEFLLFLRKAETLSGSHKNLLKEFLSLSDIVKFAKYGPTENETEESFTTAKQLIDETRPQEAEATIS